MPSSGGSVSDAPVNKVVDGKSHYLAYITPDEGKSLKDQGGQEVITDSGIPAYPPLGEPGTSPGTGSKGEPVGGAPGGGDPGITYHTTPQSYQAPTQQDRIQRIGSGIEPGYRPEDETPYGLSKEEAYRQGKITKDQYESKDIAIDRSTIEKRNQFEGIKNYILGGGMIGKTIELTGDVLSKLGEFSSGLQKKAMTMSLNNRITKIGKKSDFHPGAYGYKIQDIQSDLEGIEKGTFTQNDFTEKYGSGDLGGGEDGGGDNARGLTNIITPYAAHAIGGTTPVNSMAAQWYAGLGSGPSNPGAFNLTQEYAAAKAKVSQRLGNPTSVGQMAVSNSPFFNFLKDNSLDKGIL